MKLATASVSGLFGTYDHSIVLDTAGLTFIHSTNGMGKSVFLKLIQSLLGGRTDYLERIPFDTLALGFEDGSGLTAEKKGGLRMTLRRDGREDVIGNGTPSGMLDTMYVSPERLTVRKEDGSLVYAIDEYQRELEEGYASAQEAMRIHPEDADPGEDMTDAEIESELADLRAKAGFIAGAGLSPEIPEGLRTDPSRLEISNDHDGYLRLVRALQGCMDRCHRFAESVAVFLEVVNGFLINKHVYMSEGRMQASMSNGDSVPLETLSSGEKHILIIFYRILFHALPGSLVIIDEPEISIHVSWQQKMGRTLLDICRLRDLQMLVATHSPQIIHDMWDRANELGGGSA